MEPTTQRKSPALRRPTEGRLVAGVAIGLADYFDVDAVLVRVALVAVTLMGGLGVALYVAAWLLMPDEGSDESVAEELLDRMRTETGRISMRETSRSQATEPVEGRDRVSSS
jgi:phage shock protein C